MLAPPPFATFEVTTAAAVELLNRITIERPDNPDDRQDDHSSAFALLKQVLLRQLSLDFTNDDRIHVTPIFRSLLNISTQELELYLYFMRSQEVLIRLKAVYEAFFRKKKITTSG